ncbi:hypothetical protein LTR62_001098 [Meristemomyces frigidus]|uniref:TIM-barrel domain-containing protein n=1 Tax=Meristemomyces frigidus TaxID=1508187 RepID=A0AAN7YBR3_9PEZI|nr:hypothetical protein LTR62_001098 [Meristemomyces frigidus]
MAPPTDRKQILANFRHQIKQGKPIIGAGAGKAAHPQDALRPPRSLPKKSGIGLTAKSAETGGIDLLILYNSGRFRMAGRGSLAGLMPYGNANDVVVDMAREILPVVQKTPVLAGVCASDPFRDIGKFLGELKGLGFAGVQNFPTVGLVDGVFRQNLEETGMSYQLEVDMVRMAHEMDMLTTPYVFNPDEATKMAEAGADVVVAHMGLTTSGSIGAQTGKSLEDCVKEVQNIRDAAVNVNSEIIVLCHGGPIAKPEDAKFVLDRCPGVHGFFGASSMERLPVEEAITGITRTFKDISIQP